MAKHGKKFREAQARVPEGSAFSPTEAVSLVKELSYAKFDETVEAAVRLGVDPRHADQIVRTTEVRLIQRETFGDIIAQVASA